MTRRGFFLSLAAGLLAAVTGKGSRVLERGAKRLPRPKLSPKERQVLALRVQGLSKVEIGRELWMSPYAVGVFLENALVKLGPPLP
jgi:DNA-binding CsgD family transcriptional regulator